MKGSDNNEGSKEKPMEDEKLIWEEIATEHIVQDEWNDFRRTSYRFPDGRVV